MLKLLHNCTNFTCQQGHAQNSPSWASTVCEPKTSRCTSWIFKKAEEPEIKLPTSIGSQKKQENSINTSISTSLTTLKPLTVWITTNWEMLKVMGIPNHLTCLLRNLYDGQEATVRTRHGKTDWFDLLAAQGTYKSLLQHHSSKASTLWFSAFSMVQLSYLYMTTGKTIAFVCKVMSLLFKTLSMFVITFLPRSKCLLISWL